LLLGPLLFVMFLALCSEGVIFNYEFTLLFTKDK